MIWVLGGEGGDQRGKKKKSVAQEFKNSQLQLDRALDNRVSGWGWEYGERTDNARLRGEEGKGPIDKFERPRLPK